MKRSRKIAALALTVALAAALSGCDFVGEYLSPLRPTGASSAQRAEKRDVIRILFAFAGVETRVSGTNTPTGPGTSRVTDKIVTGPFSAKLPINISVPSQRPRAQGRVVTNKPRGKFVAQLNGTTDSNTGIAKMTGIGALKFTRKVKALGTACFKLSGTFRRGGTKGRGRFRSTGGTGGAATIRARGTFRDTVTPIDADTSKDKGKARIRAKLFRPRKPAPADCRKLAKKYLR